MTTPRIASRLYLVTNRAPTPGCASAFGDAVSAGGTLTYASALQDTVPADLFQLTDEATLRGQMAADLAAMAVDGEVNLMVFIHGFDTTWPQIQSEGASWMTGLVRTGGYQGVQLMFDWPSGHDVADFFGAMDRARGSAAESLPRLTAFLAKLQAEPALAGITVRLQMICHSMGNYLFQQGAQHFPNKSITQVLLAAAMLDYTTFNTACPTMTSGAAMSAAAVQVNVYYGCHDDVLGWAFLDLWIHQLGKDGPYSYTDALAAGVVGLDCSAVVNAVNQKRYDAPQTHTAYFYIPETLMDMAATLMGQSSPFRRPLDGTTRGFALIDDPSGVARLS